MVWGRPQVEVSLFYLIAAMSTSIQKGRTALDLGLLLLRVSAGAFMLFGHGVSKFNTAFGGGEISFPDPVGIGATASFYLVVFAEFFCSILLILGVYTRLVVVPLIIAMIVAVFMQHAGDPFGRVEKGAMYLAIFIALALTGAGRYSIDGMKMRKSE